ncbi:MAG: class I SAM-dependent methyltransferase [Gammaproteobacteria bacterium]|nr:class I SAM-dependent methyltransferase [Gammaproteobacteria bacterium]
MNRTFLNFGRGLVLAGAVLACGLAQAQDQQQRMRTALAAAARPDADKARDATRHPVEVIQFLGIKDGMTVLDVIAAGGWYTEVLSAAVGPSGKVLSQNPEFFLQRGGDDFIKNENARAARLGNVEPKHGEIPGMGINGQVDAAITALNLHDVYNRGGLEAGTAFAKGVFDALKPGGVFGVIDHAGSAGQNNAEMHRMRLSEAVAALEEAGFRIEAVGDILQNPADDHTKGIRDPSLNRNSDRFVIRARKP